MVGPQRRLSAILSADVVGYGKLVRDDETGTIEAVKRLLSVVIAPKLEEHAGRIVKLMGDGVLAEFPSVVEAVNFAVEAQAALAAEDQAIRYRMGVNLGDVIIDGDDIQGDGVNVAARLEAICAPGGLCISDLVHQAIAGKTELDFEDLGAQNLKNIDTPVRVWQWRQKDLIAGSVQVPEEQQIKFCTTPDAVSLAYAVVGQGPPLVKAPNWMNHLEYDWQSEVWRHVLRDMSRHNTLVRFDQRGNGLSDRKVSELTFDNMVDDIATVADAAGLERFALLGISQGCAYSIAYAHRYPERVSHLVLYGGFALGLAKIKDGQCRPQYEMLHRMILDGWGRDNPAFRQFFTSLFMPGANKDQMSWFNELQRKTISPETAAELLGVACHVDVTHLLAAIDIPTLVLHCRDDAVAPFEGGRRVAAGIPNARFVALEGQNHMILEDEPAWPRFLTEVRQFLAEGV
ncbi:MAG: alpha/beta fold hydrolase [Alphaproteobacteria bacterium]|nr:alpha/beta fold hydrolase [Alphaproteobacteria bacterium]